MSQGNLPHTGPDLDACGFPKPRYHYITPTLEALIEQGKEENRLRAWLTAIKDTGCFLVSGEKRFHVIPNPTCKACMATRALNGESVPK